MTRSHSSSSSSSRGTSVSTPALLTRMSTPPETLLRRVHHGRYLLVPAHVGVHRERLASPVRDQVHGLSCRREVEVGGHHAGALLRESQGNTPTVPGTGTGDDGNAFLESHGGVLPSSGRARIIRQFSEGRDPAVRFRPSIPRRGAQSAQSAQSGGSAFHHFPAYNSFVSFTGRGVSPWGLGRTSPNKERAATRFRGVCLLLGSFARGSRIRRTWWSAQHTRQMGAERLCPVRCPRSGTGQGRWNEAQH